MIKFSKHENITAPQSYLEQETAVFPIFNPELYVRNL